MLGKRAIGNETTNNTMEPKRYYRIGRVCTNKVWGLFIHKISWSNNLSVLNYFKLANFQNSTYRHIDCY